MGWCRLSMWGPKRSSTVQCAGMWCRVIPDLVWKACIRCISVKLSAGLVGGWHGWDPRAIWELPISRWLRCLLPTIWKHQASVSIIPHISIDDADDELMGGGIRKLYSTHFRWKYFFEILEVNVWNMNSQSIIVVIITQFPYLGTLNYRIRLSGKGKTCGDSVDY